MKGATVEREQERRKLQAEAVAGLEEVMNMMSGTFRQIDWNKCLPEKADRLRLSIAPILIQAAIDRIKRWGVED